ncbi:unnamed protein product (macronuclear) [Paramecium tetraurelia]|uniref:Phospholipase/carboxylesterase/thioesterase domain-containing protein n=1 Tax=Paramecium tetraurelia TaxID=5888 RepID=A0D0X8_PARTE|nr:uncharacterized protein GSPATT00012247001 [Paramecium tetraurelia]CAK76695.1 unnamed protein product [Paramecium tetraurelia]|eukprot:XP_001444092.1 hypothetical protein (macronuclear) [Paramecium tetraurelia strain d4-2]
MSIITLIICLTTQMRCRSAFKGIKRYIERILDRLIFPARSCKEYQSLNAQEVKYFSVVRRNAGEGNQNQRCNNIEFNRIVPYAFLRNELYPNTKYYVIYFHGNGENIDDAAHLVRKLMKSLKFHAFLIEYPKYGIYQYTETNAKIILEDSILAYEQIKEENKLDDSQIYIFGRSIGTGPAIHVASQKNCRGLVTISAYRSIKQLVRGMVFGVGFFVSAIMDERFNNEENIAKVRCPALFIHGVDDTLIPSHHSIFLQRKLYNQNQNARQELFSNMNHNNIEGFEYEISEKIALTFQELSKAND